MSGDDFSNEPVSITEARASRTGHAKDMTARDAVVAFLRDIDSGVMETPDFLVICFAKRVGDSEVKVNEYAGGPHVSLEIIGLLELCKARLMKDVGR